MNAADVLLIVHMVTLAIGASALGIKKGRVRRELNDLRGSTTAVRDETFYDTLPGDGEEARRLVGQCRKLKSLEACLYVYFLVGVLAIIFLGPDTITAVGSK